MGIQAKAGLWQTQGKFSHLVKKLFYSSNMNHIHLKISGNAMIALGTLENVQSLELY